MYLQSPLHASNRQTGLERLHKGSERLERDDDTLRRLNKLSSSERGRPTLLSLTLFAIPQYALYTCAQVSYLGVHRSCTLGGCQRIFATLQLYLPNKRQCHVPSRRHDASQVVSQPPVLTSASNFLLMKLGIPCANQTSLKSLSYLFRLRNN